MISENWINNLIDMSTTAIMSTAETEDESMHDVHNLLPADVTLELAKAYKKLSKLENVVKSYLLVLDQWENTNKSERLVAQAENAMRFAIEQEDDEDEWMAI